MATRKYAAFALLGFLSLFVIFLIWHFLLVIVVCLGALFLYARVAVTMKHSGFDSRLSALIPLLTVLTGVGVGAVISSDMFHGLQALIAASVPLAVLLVQPEIQYRRLIAAYQRHENHLVQP